MPSASITYCSSGMPAIHSPFRLRLSFQRRLAARFVPLRESVPKHGNLEWLARRLRMCRYHPGEGLLCNHKAASLDPILRYANIKLLCDIRKKNGDRILGSIVLLQLPVPTAFVARRLWAGPPGIASLAARRAPPARTGGRMRAWGAGCQSSEAGVGWSSALHRLEWMHVRLTIHHSLPGGQGYGQNTQIFFGEPRNIKQ